MYPANLFWLPSSSSSSSDDEDLIPPGFEEDNAATIFHLARQSTSLMEHMYLLNEEHPQHGGSVMGRRHINRLRKEGHDRIVKDYFGDKPIFGEEFFTRRYRMKRSMFMRILNAVENHQPYFRQRRDALGYLGLSPLQKVTAAFRMLAYGVAADMVDEYVRIGESTTIESLNYFCQAVIDIFGEEYLCSPTTADIQRLLSVGERRGFPGMLGSVDCMHWKWKNCPTAWQGMYKGHHDKPTIVLEAVASYDTWIWHAFFGMPGSNNDINVLDRSPLFNNLARGRAPPCNFTINGATYDMGYYLADGIYPDWATMVKTISEPQGNKKKHFAKMQEKYRKDVERTFGILQSRFAIVRGPARGWDQVSLKKIMQACIIMHNMIVEEDRIDYDVENIDMHTFNYEHVPEVPFAESSHDMTTEFNTFLSRHERIQDQTAHINLRNNLIEHLWNHHGE